MYSIYFNTSRDMFSNVIKSQGIKVPTSVMDNLVFLKTTLTSKDDAVLQLKTCNIVVKTENHLLFDIKNYKDVIDRLGEGCYIQNDNSTDESLIIIHLENLNRNNLLTHAGNIIELLHNDNNVISTEVTLDLVVSDGTSTIYETRPSMLVKELFELAKNQNHVQGELYLNVKDDMQRYFLPTYLLSAFMLKNNQTGDKINIKFLNDSKNVLSAVEEVVDTLVSGGVYVSINEIYSMIDDKFILDRERYQTTI